MAHLLVIDDDDTLRYTLRRMLEAAGHRVSEADDGDAGLSAFERDPADLVLCDIFMPEKEGLEVILELLRLSPGVKIIAMSGGSSLFPRDYLQCAEVFGAVRTIDKSFEMTKVVAVVQEVLEQQRK